MLAEGTIQHSTSAWSTLIVVVPHGEKKRFCLDFKAINEVTRKDAYPIPAMATILD